MNKKIYVMITAGRGPLECGLAVRGIQKKFKEEMKRLKVDFRIASQKMGRLQGTMETIVFEINQADFNKMEHWIGTHKWVCQSPIRKFHKRRNWFVKCEKIELSDAIEISEKEVVCQTFRASGPGGQHRNKVETAVRLIHVKSGLIVTASDGKSQHQNRKKAWEKLRLKMKEINESTLKMQNLERWSEQIEVERGNPVKVFVGTKFKEKK